MNIHAEIQYQLSAYYKAVLERMANSNRVTARGVYPTVAEELRRHAEEALDRYFDAVEQVTARPVA